jgi:hypothetical protein
MSANNAYGYSWIDTHPLTDTDYSVVKDITIQHHFKAIHEQLQRDQAWVSLGFAVRCIELMKQAAEQYAKAADPQWRPK